MRTPKEYSKLIKKGIITDQIIAECIYSVNKRAKNCRDKLREYKNSRYAYLDYHYMDNLAHYEDQRDKYYSMKDELLSIYTPVCIHKQHIGYPSIRVYSYEKKYEKKKRKHEKDIVWENSYCDYDSGEEVEFFDYEDKSKDNYLYFLFYEIGEYSYHTPIYMSDIKERYSDLEVKRINDNFRTFGLETDGLLSVQFVNKVLALIKSGNYTYQKSDAKKGETKAHER